MLENVLGLEYEDGVFHSCLALSSTTNLDIVIIYCGYCYNIGPSKHVLKLHFNNIFSKIELEVGYGSYKALQFIHIWGDILHFFLAFF